MTEPGLACIACSKSYGGAVALEQVSLHVRPGEVVGLVGSNGAGKTTLLHGIVGLTRFDSGTVTVDGIPAHRPEAKRRVAFMPDDLPRPRHLTARELITFVGSLYGRRVDPVDIDRLADTFDLGHRLDHPLAGFSHGMTRKVDLIAALAVEPSVLVMDEPFSGMDPNVVDTMSTVIAERRALGNAVLLSTHDLDLAAGLVDRVVLIDHGQVLVDDDLGSVLADSGSSTLRSAFRSMTGRER